MERTPPTDETRRVPDLPSPTSTALFVLGWLAGWWLLWRPRPLPPAPPRTTTVSVAVRLGFPIGANIAGHRPVAPAGILRVRRSLAQGGSGLMVVGGLGGGVLSDTIKLEGAPENMDTDVVSMGPLIVNLGAGYHASLGGGVGLVAELNALAGVPVTKKLGNAILNFGVQFDFNLGLVLGF